MSSNLGGLQGLIRPWRAFMKQQHTALTRSTQAVTRETRTQDLLAESSAGASWQIMWIDGVGGYLLIDKEEIMLGQAIAGTSVDIGIVGDLSRQAAVFRRTEGDYLLQPLQPTKLDGIPIDRSQLLPNEALLQLGERVKVRFRRPSPLSATARLDLVSLNRFKPNVDGILLLSDSCILGPNPGSHVVCPNWTTELLLFRHGAGWQFRSMVEVNVNGQPQIGQIPLTKGMRMDGEDFSLSIE